MTRDKGKTKHLIRPAVAGPQGFYPTEPAALRNMIQRFLDEAEFKSDAAPFGLIAPHAGYVYSGPVAGWAYRQVQGRRFKSVIVLAPSHMTAFSFASVMPDGSYATPLGEIPVDDKLAARLVKDSGVGVPARLSYQGHSAQVGLPAEHSLEVQLPFLQVTLGDFKLVPVVIGSIDPLDCQKLGAAIAEVANEDVLVVASSDLSHYHSYDEAYQLDEEVICLVKSKAALELAEGCHRRELEACGGMPIAALMFAAEMAGAGRVEILRHKTSGDVPRGSRDQVVGYLAAAFYHGALNESEENETESDDVVSNVPFDTANVKDKVVSNETFDTTETKGSGLTFSPAERDYLLRLARQAIGEALWIDTVPKIAAQFHPVLQEYRGMFVTLKINSRLRGCIGNLSPKLPIGELVRKVAVQAAFEDPRFPRLTKAEFDRIKLDITVLGAMTRLKKPEDLEVGSHGVMISKGYQQGLLLPQVAVELGWNRRQFLEGVCQKAGLPVDAWKEKETQLFIFTADCFGEK